MADRISLTGLEATGYHGVFDFEKREGQSFSVDLVLEADLSAPGASDDLADTVDYGALAELVHARITGEPFDLIEALAESIAQDVLEFAGSKATAASVTVHKPQAPIQVAFSNAAVTVRRERRRMVLALGSNLGDSLAILAAAVEALKGTRGISVEAVSDVARTKPVGGPADQPDYFNLVVTGTTTLTPNALLTAANRIEAAHERVREVRWAARTLDIDVISLATSADGMQHQMHSIDPHLTLPHPRAHERGFVLVPWAWAEPEAVLDGTRIADLAAAAMDTPDIERLGSLEDLGSRGEPTRS